MRRDGRCRAGLRRLVPFLVVGLVLGPLASAVLHPDPLWIPGLYDGGDADDLVLATRADGAPPVLVPDARPRLEPVPCVCVSAVRHRSAPAPLAAPSRAPPAA